MRTKRLYDEDAYLASFDALVQSAVRREDGLADLVLDQTAFFPEGGGQPPDRGSLAWGEQSFLVRDVQLQDGVITHTVEGEAPLPQAGALIRGTLDFACRLDRMRHHTGEHIVSGIVCSRFSCSNVGFRLSDSHMTMDYDALLTEGDIAELERAANAAVTENIPVRAFFPDEEEASRLPYRSKKEIEGEALRLVEIAGIDLCACCAPHVRATGEIGLIKIVRLQNWKGGVRLSVACGERALALFAEEHAMVTELARALSTSPENIPDRFRRMREEIAALKKELAPYRKAAKAAEARRGEPEAAPGKERDENRHGL